MLNSWACHTSATHFEDPKRWDPRRWIDAVDGRLVHPTADCAFYAWGAGPRICPGMKFAQVEFCAVMSCVLRKVRVVGEKEGVMRALRDSVADPLLLHVRRPEALKVEIVER